MKKFSWKRSFLAAEVFDSEMRLVAMLNRPLLAMAWSLDWHGERYLIRRKHIFSRDYEVTKARTGEPAGTIRLPFLFSKMGGRMALLPENQEFHFSYTNLWKRHFRVQDNTGNISIESQDISLFGWQGTLQVQEDVPELVVVLASFIYLRMSMRRRAARS
jgi:hypothetical protein